MEKAISITHSEFMFIQDAQRMPRIILSSVACQGLRFSPQSLSEIFPILRRILRQTITNVLRASCKVHVILSYCNEPLIFSACFEKSSNIKFMILGPAGAKLFRAEGQTDAEK